MSHNLNIAVVHSKDRQLNNSEYLEQNLFGGRIAVERLNKISHTKPRLVL